MSKLTDIHQLFLTFDNEEIWGFIALLIDSKNPKRIDHIKIAISMGYPINYENRISMTLLYFAVSCNDIPTVLFLVKNGADIHYSNDKLGNVVHLCVTYDNDHLLKYFINLGVDYNLLLDTTDCLSNACLNYSMKCIEILLKYVTVNNAFECLINEILSIVASFKPLEKKHIKMNKIFPIVELIVQHITELDGEIFYKLIDAFMFNDIEIHNLVYCTWEKRCDINVLKLILSKFPEYINSKIINDNNILQCIIPSNDKEMILFILSLDTLDLMSKDKNNLTYLHLAIEYGIVWLTEVLYKKCPELKHEPDLLHYAVKQYKYNSMYVDTELYKTEDNIISIIDIISPTKDNINSVDNNNVAPIQCAILNNHIKVVDTLIKLGANTVDSESIKATIKLNNINMLKLLLDNGYKLEECNLIINTRKKNGKVKPIDINIQIEILYAFMFKRDCFVLYLLDLDEVKKKLTEEVKKYLYKIALIEGTTNTEIYNKLLPINKKNKCIKKSQLPSKYDVAENIIARSIDSYSEDRECILNMILKHSEMIYKIFTFNKNNVHSILHLCNDICDIYMKKPQYIYTFTESYCYIADYYEMYDYCYCYQEISKIISLFDLTDDLIIKKIKMLRNIGLKNHINKIAELVDVSKYLMKKYKYKIPKTDHIQNYYNAKFKDILDSVQNDLFITNITQNAELKNLYGDMHLGELSKYGKMDFDSLIKKFNGNSDNSNNSNNNDNNNDNNNEKNLDNSDDNIIDSDKYIDDNDDDINKYIDDKLSAKINSSYNNDEGSDVTEYETEFVLYDNILSDSDEEIEEIENNTIVQKHKPINQLDDLNYNVVNKLSINNSRKIIKTKILLTKLYHSAEKDHYDSMYDNLLTSEYYYKFSKNNILIKKNKDIIGKVFNIETSFPSTWFRYYAPNIGSVEKRDVYHMFPFILDSILDKYNCIEKSSVDINNPDKNNTLLFFPGLLIIDGIKKIGYYEYFINSNGTLFHRLFREKQIF